MRTGLRKRGMVRMAAAVALTLAASEAALGQTFFWINSGGGVFSQASNWSPFFGPPSGPAQAAVFDLNNNYTVSFTGAASHGTLTMNAGSVAFLSSSGLVYNVATASFSGATLTLSSTGASMILSPSGLTTVGAGARINLETNGFFSPTGNVLINGGSIFRNNNANGLQPSNGRTITIQGGGTLNITGTYFLENANTVSVTNGLFNVTSSLNVGFNGSGSLTANGANARVAAPTAMTWGSVGSTANVSFLGGSVGTFGQVTLGSNQAGSTGRLNVVSSTLTTGFLSIGSAGENATGEITLSGVNPVLTQTGANGLAVGTITGTGTNGTLTLSSGTFTTGTGITTINPRGLINIDGGNFRPLGNVNVNGGMVQISSGSLRLAPSRTMTIQGGGVVSDTSPFSGFFSLGENQTISVTNGTLTTNRFIDIGDGGAGTMLINGANARVLMGADLYIGGGGGSGTVIVSNSGSASFGGGVSVGFDPIANTRGVLQIDTSAQVSAGGYGVIVGGLTGAEGGSITLNSGTLTAAGATIFPTGVLNINGGVFASSGSVNVNGGLLSRNVISQAAFSLAPGQTLFVQGGGTASFTGSFGVHGGRTATITDGLLAVTNALDVGFGGGTLNVSGPNARVTAGGAVSSWAADDVAVVNFSNGSAGTFGGVQMGFTPGGVATLTINGASFTCESLRLAQQTHEIRAAIHLHGVNPTLTQTGAAELIIGASTGNLANGTVSVVSGTFTTGTGLTTINPRGLLSLGAASTNPGTFRAMGDVVVNGGTISVGEGFFDLAPGRTMTVQNGGNVSIDSSKVGFSSLGAGQTINITDGILATNRYIDAGDGGIGTFLVNGANARALMGSTPFVGTNGGQGTMIISNAGVATFSGIGVGEGSLPTTRGFLLIDTGGRLTSPGFEVQVGDVGGAAVGTVSINDGTLTAQGALVFPNSRIDIAPAGALVLSTGGSLNIAGGTVTRQSTAVGRLQIPSGQPIRITDGGLLSITGGFSVPNGSTMTILSGGDFVASGAGAALNIGISGQTGTMTVSGAGSSVSGGAATWGSGQLVGFGAATVSFTNNATGSFSTILLGSGTGSGRLDISGGATVTAGAATIGGNGFATAVNINSGGALNAGAATFTGNSSLNVTIGAATLGGNTTFSGALATINGTANFNGSVTGLNALVGSGTVIFRGAASGGGINRTGTTRVDQTGSLVATHVRDNMLIVNGPVSILPNGTASGTSRVNTLTLAGGATPTARIDLANNDMVIDYGGASPISTVRQQIRAAHANGAWTGNGISTSAGNAAKLGLGFAESSAVFTSFPATFSGQSVDNTAVLIAFTLYGDSNLDRVVNLADFNNLAANFGQSDRLWSQGDFNYDGLVNLSDFNLLAANFGQVASGPEVTPQDWFNLASSVPEPTGGLLLAGLMLASSRRRRAPQPAAK